MSDSASRSAPSRNAAASRIASVRPLPASITVAIHVAWRSPRRLTAPEAIAASSPWE
jgi:hypothetical protein